jgi:hypothetical protein
MPYTAPETALGIIDLGMGKVVRIFSFLSAGKNGKLRPTFAIVVRIFLFVLSFYA